MTNLNINQSMIKQILSLIRTMEESCEELYGVLSTDSPALPPSDTEYHCQILFNDLGVGISGLLQYSGSLKSQMEHACFEEMAFNIDCVLYTIIDLINQDQMDRVLYHLKFELYPFLQELWEEVYFWGLVYPDPSHMESYYLNEFAPHHASSLIDKGEETEFRYKFSFFIPVFNKLEYTKACIDSIRKHTDLIKYPCEFILLNDGSNDGSQEYFESLKLNADKKIIYLRKNVKTAIFSLAMRVCEGEYLLFVNNDTLVTKGWLDNLQTCMESDPYIISASPCTPNTSNLQGDMEGRYPYSSPKETIKHKNCSKPELWEERSRLMPAIAIYRTSLVNRIGFADRLFYTLEFWDDDFSLRARRAGYKQILCRDTYCYHFGSVTGKDGQIYENTLEKGRALFLLKNHTDPWERDSCYDYRLTDLLNKAGGIISNDSRYMLLGIDCGYGDTMRKIKSDLKKNLFLSETSDISVFTAYTNEEDQLYRDDLKSFSNHCIIDSDISRIEHQLAEHSLDCIYLGRPLEFYEHYESILKLAERALKRGGYLIFSMTNVYYKPFLESFLTLSFPDQLESVRFINLSSLQKRLKDSFSRMDCVAQTEVFPDAEEFSSTHMNRIVNPSILPLLTARYLKFCCKK